MIDGYLAQVKRAIDSRDAYLLAELCSPHPSSHIFNTLRVGLRAGPALRPSSYVDTTRTVFHDNRPLADFVASFLLFARDADLESEDGDLATAAYQLLEDCYKGACNVFGQAETGWFVATLRQLTRALVTLALRAGMLMGDTNLTKAGEAATLIRRPLTIAANDRSTSSPPKRDALFFLANSTFKVYFTLKNLRMCDTILNSTQTATATLQLYPKADRVAYSYYRGRMYLYQRRLPQARQEFLLAFSLCDSNSPQNGRLILIYLIVASLPLGFFPSETLLDEFHLQEQFGDLVPPLHLGDFMGVKAELERWQGWHQQLGNFLLLREKLELVCWRNLIRRTLFVVSDGHPLPADGSSPPTLSLHALLKTARVSFGDPTLDVDDVESMCISLVDQGYIKAYILHSKRLLVFMKGPQVGFPPMASVHALP
ncbi:hypothetical protein RQP46_000497 [Phenoliferia psychrophenolica]